MTNYEIVDNFLDANVFLKIKNEILDFPYFPWFLNNSVSGQKSNDGIYFTHIFLNDFEINSEKINILNPIIDKLQFKKLIRIKANLYPKTDQLKIHNSHIDFNVPHIGCILYLNTNDGKTIINDEVEIDSIENRMLFFEPHVPHKSTTCTTKDYRSNINFNYF
jgi:hypothetical protein